MKLVVFDEKKIKSIKKRDIIKYVMLVLATPSGLLISCVLAYLNIDFIELLKVFSENISNPEVLDKLGHIMGKWYIISFSMVFVALLLLVIYFACNRKKNEEDALTWEQTLVLTSELILISQFLLPLFTITVLIGITLLYFVFFRLFY